MYKIVAVLFLVLAVASLGSFFFTAQAPTASNYVALFLQLDKLVAMMAFVLIAIGVVSKETEDEKKSSEYAQALLSGTALLALAWCMILLKELVLPQTSLMQNDSLSSSMQEVAFQTSGLQDMVALINQKREDAGLQPLERDSRLDASAELKACDMRDRGYYGHQDPDGQEAWYLIEGKGIRYERAGENLIEGFPGDEQALVALMESPSHRENILSNDFTHIGIGRCGVFTVQHFVELTKE